jgi:hypothetical protein
VCVERDERGSFYRTGRGSPLGACSAGVFCCVISDVYWVITLQYTGCGSVLDVYWMGTAALLRCLSAVTS